MRGQSNQRRGSIKGKNPKKKVRGKRSYSAKKSRRTKKIRQVKVFISVAFAFLFAISLTFQLVGNSSPKALTPTPTPKASPTKSTTNSSDTVKATAVDPYTEVDSMAILGAFAVARQTPSTTKGLKAFIAKIKSAKDNPGTSKLDLAILGNRLVDYSISDKGFLNPVCYAVKAPSVVNQMPKQSVWVIYFEPATKTKSALILISLGVMDCHQASLASSKISSNSQRIKISNASHQIIQAALNKVPASFLSPVGLAILDESRGLAPSASSQK